MKQPHPKKHPKNHPSGTMDPHGLRLGCFLHAQASHAGMPLGFTSPRRLWSETKAKSWLMLLNTPTKLAQRFRT